MTNTRHDDEDTIVIDPTELAFSRTTTCTLPPPVVPYPETIARVRVLGRIELCARKRQRIPVIRFEDLEVGADE